MIDITGQINATSREVGRRHIPAGDGRTVLLRRRYDAPVDEVWDACTDPARLKRWFLPVSGDLRLGGRYQIESNAGGEILACDPPRLLRVSWVYQDNPASQVELRLAAADAATLLELEHATGTEDGAAAAGVGVGWDLTVLGLDLHLRGETIDDLSAWESSPEARDFITRSSAAWGEALQAAGVPADQAATIVRDTTQFYAPDPAPDSATAQEEPGRG